MYDADGELMSALSVSKSAWTPSPELNESACVKVLNNRFYSGVRKMVTMKPKDEELLWSHSTRDFYRNLYLLFGQ